MLQKTCSNCRLALYTVEFLLDFPLAMQFLKDPAMYTSIGGKPPKGILLEGDPGTGDLQNYVPPGIICLACIIS